MNLSKRHLLRVFGALAAAAVSPRGFAQASPVIDARAVVRHHGTLVHASYEDTLAAALDMRTALATLVAQPSAETLSAARKAWLDAREWYGQTEAYRFYGGPIDDARGPEGRINAWPVDESYIDAIVADRRAPITKANLARLNERGGEENIATGWHAIEYLLWGRDGNDAGPGDRPFEDYAGAPNERRRRYITVAAELLLDDLRGVAAAWAPNARNYRARFEAGGTESLRKMIVGLGSLSRGELAGERMEVALATQDQEDEHSCFADNTHRDIVANALGIQNVWLGRYRRRDGSTLQGPGLRDLVAAKDAALAQRTSERIAATLAAAHAIRAPFDREIVGAKDAPGRARVQATVDALVAQSKDLVDAATALGIRRLTLVDPKK